MGKVIEWKELVGDVFLVVIGGMLVECVMGVFEVGVDIVFVVIDIILNEDFKVWIKVWIEVCL